MSGTGLERADPDLRRSLDAAGSDLSIRRLQAFWAVAHTESITKAAKLMGIAQPSLSQQLATFEAAIGGQLFHRRGGHLDLTELGASLLPRAEQRTPSARTCPPWARQHGRIERVAAGEAVRTELPDIARGQFRHFPC